MLKQQKKIVGKFFQNIGIDKSSSIRSDPNKGQIVAHGAKRILHSKNENCQSEQKDLCDGREAVLTIFQTMV